MKTMKSRYLEKSSEIMTIHALCGKLESIFLLFDRMNGNLAWNNFSEGRYGTRPLHEGKRILDDISRAIQNYDESLGKYIHADSHPFVMQNLLDDIRHTRDAANHAVSIYKRLIKNTKSDLDRRQIKHYLKEALDRINRLVEIVTDLVKNTTAVVQKEKLGIDWKEEFLLYPMDTAFLGGMDESKMRIRTGKRLLKESDVSEKLMGIEFLIPDPDDCDIDDDGFWVAGFFGYRDGRYDYLLEKMLDDDFDDTIDVLKCTFVRNNRKEDSVYWFKHNGTQDGVIDEDTFPEYPWLYGVIYDECLDRVDDFCRDRFKASLDEIV